MKLYFLRDLRFSVKSGSFFTSPRLMRTEDLRESVRGDVVGLDIRLK